MKNAIKNSLVALISIVLVTCTVVGTVHIFNRNDDTGETHSKYNNSSKYTSSEILSSDDTSTDLTSSELESSDFISSNEASSGTNSSTVSNRPTNSTNSTVSTRPNTSSTPSQNNTSSVQQIKTFEQKAADGNYEIKLDTNLNIRYYEDKYGDFFYEFIYDGKNTARHSYDKYWDPDKRMYYHYTTDNVGFIASFYSDEEKAEAKQELLQACIKYGLPELVQDKPNYAKYYRLKFIKYTNGERVYVSYEIKEECLINLCRKCGKPSGNGTDGTCNRAVAGANWKCRICGALVDGYICHSCPNGYHSDMSSMDAKELL